MSSKPTKGVILLTGGTGKISSRIAPLLSAHGDTTLVASRAGTTPLLQRCQGIKFDWLDPATYSTLFEYGPISAVFLVAPPIMDCLSPMKEFIDLAVQKGARRFVLLSASVVDSGDGPMIEKISKYITTIGVDYAILQPTWFMENFSEMQHFHTIRDENRIVTATGEGKVPFVSADDIAAIAFRALTDEVPHNTNHLILGSELWSYDEVATLLTQRLNRQIIHVNITEAEMAAAMSAFMSKEYATILAQLDTAVKSGRENRTNNIVEQVTGKKPVKFEDYIRKCVEKGVWEKKYEGLG